MKKVLVSLLVLTMTITGCGTGASIAEKNYQDISPSIVQIGDLSSNGRYCYIVDKNTGVVYLQYSSGDQCGITVMLNRDGTPVLADQLEIIY